MNNDNNNLFHSKIEEINDIINNNILEIYRLNKILENELKTKYPPYDGPKWPSMCDPDDEAVEKWRANGGGQPLPKDWDKINMIKEKIKELELENNKLVNNINKDYIIKYKNFNVKEY